MADETGVKVSQLPLGENLADDDLMYAVEGGISKKVEVGYLKRIFGGGGGEIVIAGEASGAIASFSDGSNNPLVKLEADINPIQDLHGYSKPWAGGAGKNKLQVTATSQTINGVTFTVNADGTVLVNGTASGITVFTINNISNLGLTDGTQYILSGCSGGTSSTYKLDILKDNGSPEVINYNGDTTFTKEAILNKEIRIVVYSGITVNNIVFKPMIRLATETDATFAPYTNICPISGWSSVEVTGAGTNVWDEEWELGIYSLTDGSPVASNYSIRSKNRISVKPNTQYYFNNQYFRVLFYDSNDDFISYVSGLGAKTTPSNCSYVRFYLGDAYGTTYNNDVSINYPSTDTSYHPYNSEGTTETISLGQTVYGGKLNVTTGELTVDRALVDLGTLNWTLESSVFRLTTDIGAKITSNTSEVANMICSIYETVSQSTMGGSADKCVAGLSWGYGVRVKDTSYSDASSFKSAMDGVQLVYELATPTTITLTPTQIDSLLGNNNIWTDSGDVDVVYIRDLNLFLNQLDARVKALENA